MRRTAFSLAVTAGAVVFRVPGGHHGRERHLCGVRCDRVIGIDGGLSTVRAKATA
jgi:hypothetical protein